MGNKQSAVQSADEKQLAKYGVFSLRSSQAYVSDVITDMVNELVNTKSVFDLEDILTNEGKCKSLFIVLLGTIKQEFVGLRFPESNNPTGERSTFFMPTSKYTSLVDEDKRKVSCNHITYFIIRLVTLIAAISASIRVNPALADRTFGVKPSSSGALAKQNKDYRMPDEINQLVGRDKIPDWILNKLTTAGHLKRVMFGTEADSRPLYFFNTYNTVVINTEKSVLFSPLAKDAGGEIILKDTTGILGITIRPYEAQTQTQRSGYMPQFGMASQMMMPPGYPPMMTQGQPPLQPWEPRPPTNTALPLVRTRRGRRHSRRKTRRVQRGGGVSFWEIVIKQVFCSDCRELGKFILDDYGNTYDYAEFKAREGSSSPPTAVIFAERMMKFLDAEPTTKQYKNPEVGAVSSQKTGLYSPIYAREPPTIARLKTIYTTLKEIEEGTSPANYRAFLLASRVNEEKNIMTSFCKDKWAGQAMSSSVAYSLLQSLYKSDEVLDGPVGKSELTELVARFNAGIADKVQGVGSVETFDQIKFRTPNTRADLKSICADTESQVLINNKYKEIVMLTHRDLRKLYDVHVNMCVQFLKQIVSFSAPSGYSSKPVLRIHPDFYKSEKGSMVLLNEYIRQARTFIGEHYLRTEEIYNKALNTLGAMSSGIRMSTNGRTSTESQSSSRTA